MFLPTTASPRCSTLENPWTSYVVGMLYSCNTCLLRGLVFILPSIPRERIIGFNASASHVYAIQVLIRILSDPEDTLLSSVSTKVCLQHRAFLRTFSNPRLDTPMSPAPLLGTRRLGSRCPTGLTYNFQAKNSALSDLEMLCAV